MNRTRVVSAVFALTLISTVDLLVAGPINPPAGPVASTMKTLAEVEPRIAINAINTPGDNDATPSLYKITQPGSYYLTGNIQGVAGKHGIEIVARGVTIDLNGFDMVGVAGMGAFGGIVATASGLNHIEVRDGSIRNWGTDGINLGGAGACIVRNVRSSGNALRGVFMGGGGEVRGSVAYLNATGFQLSSGVAISECNAYDNASTGIIAELGCTIVGCNVTRNASFGIQAGGGSTVEACTVYLNESGGIFASWGCTIAKCSVYANAGEGISTWEGCHITDCAVRSNTSHGIHVTGQCTVIGNACSDNGAGAAVSDGAGILVTGSENRVEGNTCSNADRGIRVTTPGNIMMRNTCSGNTINWVIAANNVYGPIIDRTATASPAVNGNAAADASGSSHPNANFTY